MIKCFTILPCLLMMFQPLNAKVDPPNYEFKIETFEPFFPEKNFKSIPNEYGPALEIQGSGRNKIFQFKIKHTRYVMPVFVQHKNDVIEDFFVKLPSYFLHDVFLQSLVNRLGKQDQFKRAKEEAVYIWNKKPLIHVYSAACTITCFPIFYTVYREDQRSPLLHQMKDASTK